MIFLLLVWISLAWKVAAQSNSHGFSWRNFQWVDSSCQKYADRLDLASAELESLLQTAIKSLGPNASLRTATSIKMRLAMFGNDDPEGRQPWMVFNRILKATREEIPLSLYCDGSAFKWVTSRQDDGKAWGHDYQKGDELPRNFFKVKFLGIRGGFYSTRYSPQTGPTYVSALPRSNVRDDPEGNDYCASPLGQDEDLSLLGLTQVHGGHVVLCPGAFDTTRVKKLLQKGKNYPPGTPLDEVTSTSAVLLHELTHAIAGMRDIHYGCIMSHGAATSKNEKIRQDSSLNADNFMFYAMGVFLDRNDWSTCIARTVGPRHGTLRTSKTL